MEGKKQTRSTNAQLKKLTEFMSLNPAFANGEFTGPLGSRKIEAQWRELKDLLKELGPDKSVEQWKQTWRDLKRKARHANAEASAAYAITGNPEKPVPLSSDMNNIILSTIGHECSTGTGPNESGIGRRIPMAIPVAVAHPRTSPSAAAQQNIVLIEDILEPATDTSENVQSTPSSTPARKTRQQRQHQGNIPPVAFLDMQQTNLLKSLCGLMEERNNIMRDHNRLLKKRRFTR